MITKIPNLPFQQVAFRASKKNKVNIYVLYAWQKICEYYTNEIKIDNSFDKDKLRTKYEKIKQTMFLEPNQMILELQQIFKDCGIAFSIVKHFSGAPVQGFIRKHDNKISLCMTIRQSYADIFWFSLFHEIGHLINEEFNNYFIDYNFIDGEIEKKADEFAENILINNDKYIEFLKTDINNYQNIKRFAKDQRVTPTIVIGRIQKDLNDYKFMSKYRVRYRWISE